MVREDGHVLAEKWYLRDREHSPNSVTVCPI